MEIFFLNYKDEVKRLISENYEPADTLSKEFEKTTLQLTNELLQIFPSNALDEHLVYEVLRELGFEPKEKEPLCFSWYFKRKNNI
jgi:hypothetical protein